MSDEIQAKKLPLATGLTGIALGALTTLAIFALSKKEVRRKIKHTFKELMEQLSILSERSGEITKKTAETVEKNVTSLHDYIGERRLSPN